MSCVQLPCLHIQSEALGFQHPEALFLKSTAGPMNVALQMSYVMSMKQSFLIIILAISKERNNNYEI